MNGLIVGSLGIYLLMVGFNGNAKKLKDYLQADGPGFFPWAVSIAVLAVAYENEQTRKVAQPFIGLVILTFILSNFDRLKADYIQIRDMALGASAAAGMAPAATVDPVSQIPTGGDQFPSPANMIPTGGDGVITIH